MDDSGSAPSRSREWLAFVLDEVYSKELKRAPSELDQEDLITLLSSMGSNIWSGASKGSGNLKQIPLSRKPILTRSCEDLLSNTDGDEDDEDVTLVEGEPASHRKRPR